MYSKTVIHVWNCGFAFFCNTCMHVLPAISRTCSIWRCFALGHRARMLLAISRTCCTSAFTACSRQPRRWTPFVRYFTYSLHLCLPSHIVLCVRKVKEARQIAVNSNSLVVAILRYVVNHEKNNGAKPLLWLLFVAFEQHHVGLFLNTVGLFCVPS